MAINIDKILTISAEEYAMNKKTALSNYNLIGVHSKGSVEDFAEVVQNNAEVVVNYKATCCSGTALVPKKTSVYLWDVSFYP